MERIETDIVISGGGIAGLTAAAAFGTAGFRVVIVDPTPPVTTADADGADLRTTAFLQPAQAFLAQAGLWDTLAPYATPLNVMRIIDAAQDPAITTDFIASEISDEPFGWNLPNWRLRQKILERLNALDTVQFRQKVGFDSMLTRSHENRVRLTDGTQISCQLLIGADGRNSAVRRAARIEATLTRYGQKAVTCAVTHPTPHHNVSTEVHRKGGPFTLVPLPDHNGSPCSAVVWMTAIAEADRLYGLDDTAFNHAATDRSAETLGPLQLVSPRSVWPIISQIASQLTAERTALVAEAAHVMPPIGAQGLNMSLTDLATLCDLAQEHPLGSPDMLDHYAKTRHRDMKLRVAGIDALNRASQTGRPLLQNLRASGIKALGDITPLRKQLMQLGLGVR
jgi:2-octaprenyl-6-methoxyphenol hydroxylase